MTRPRLAPQALALLLTTIAAAGCSGDDQGESASAGVTTGDATTTTTTAGSTGSTGSTAGSTTTDGTSAGTTDATTSPSTTAPATTSDETTTSTTTTTGSTGDTSDGSSSGTTGAVVDPVVLLPKQALEPAELGVLVNTSDPLSVAIADYYMSARGIPAENRVDLALTTDKILPAADFAALGAQVDAALPPSVQALALTWNTPYRVDCMSITSAFALGFDMKYCATPCNPTAPSPYYRSESQRPFTDLGVRPAMTIAAVDLDDAKLLIDRGIASDDTFPAGDGYLLRTTDVARSVRWPDFQLAVSQWDYEGGLALEYIDNSGGMGDNFIQGKGDVLFYFTGLPSVPEIFSNTFRPGALADHLTSFGGQIPTSGQMSAIEWLKAGATASYGTVVEPCNYPQKFPEVTAALPYYFRGQTVIEAYWKSVAWPGEGIFIGEPLARPWGATTVDVAGGVVTITTTMLRPGVAYALYEGPAEDGPWTPVLAPITLEQHELHVIEYGPAGAPYVRLGLAE